MFWSPKSSLPAPEVACVSPPPGEWAENQNQMSFLIPRERLEAAALHARYLDDVYRYVARRVAQREEAEDITAETFAAAFESLPKFRGQCEPRLWLFGIARRKIADASRRRKRRPETLASEIEEHAGATGEPTTGGMAAGSTAAGRAGTRDEPAAAFHQIEANHQIRALMAALKEEQREVLLLKYVEELSINEIAVVIGRSAAATNSLLQRARATVFQQGHAYFMDDEVTK